MPACERLPEHRPDIWAVGVLLWESLAGWHPFWNGSLLQTAQRIEAGAQILEALAHAHGRGIVHRDVKPSNVLVAESEEESVRLLDFGLAQLAEEEPLTATGDVPGTLAYVPPERLVHGESGGPPADVWAVGVLLWEALAGWHPFWNGSLLETAKRIEAGATPLAQARPDLPKPLTALIDRMLAIDPAARPPAARLASEVRDAFAERLRRRKPRTTLPPLDVPATKVAIRLAAPAAAGVFAGWTAAALPFFPPLLAPILALLAFGLTLVRPRLGLAFTLAVPVLPLGNVSSGLALVYTALACAWLALCWRSPREGLFLAVGPLFAPLLALGFLPLASQAVRSRPRRALQVGAAVLLAAVVAGLRQAPLPFTGAAPPRGLGITGSDDPFAVAVALWRSLLDHPALLFEALALAAAAIVLPHGLRHGSLGHASLQVELDPARARSQEGEPFVERRELDRNLRMGVGKDERAVQLEHVDLDEVAAELHRKGERGDRVLGRQRRGTTMADTKHAPLAPSEVDHVKRLRTTTARSSPSSPANARQSATSASAISCAGRSTFASRAALSRFSP